MNMELDFHGYRIIEVWQKTTAEQRDEAARFWLSEGAMNDEDQAMQRTRQLVTLVRDSSGALAGVSTAYLAVLGEIETPHYFYRMFISAGNRRSLLMIRVAQFSQDVLKQSTQEGFELPSGMVIVTENPKIMRPGAQRLLHRHGYRLLGQNGSGQDVWRVGFFD
jgi:hypothetical protein